MRFSQLQGKLGKHFHFYNGKRVLPARRQTSGMTGGEAADLRHGVCVASGCRLLCLPLPNEPEASVLTNCVPSVTSTLHTGAQPISMEGMSA